MSTRTAAELAKRYLAQQAELGGNEIIIEKSTSAETTLSLEALRGQTEGCQDCPLGKTRTKFVFGSGSPRARLMFVGEAPGFDEDQQGLPFVGAAGKLLTKMIEAMGLSREDVYIANTLKCRPPNNRDPEPEELAACRHILDTQIEIIKPAFICALGRIAAHELLGNNEPLGKLRNRFFDVRGAKLLVTYHPSALLRNPQWKRPAWEDLQMIMKEMKK